jgi:3-methyladenine DNA glycosylase AlkD
MSTPLKQIQQQLVANSTKEARQNYEKFVPGSTEKIYGVKTPVLNELARRYKGEGFALAEELWKAGAYEEKMIAAKMLGMIAKKDPERSLQLVQQFSKGIGDWAICDTIGMQSLKPLVKSHQKEIFDLAWKLNSSKNFWQRRLSLVLVEWHTRIKELHPEIKKLIKNLEKDDEYYVKKAVVWITKNFAKGK